MSNEALDRLTERIIECVYRVSNTLGCGFLEKVYENAVVVELKKANWHGVQQKSIEIEYEGVSVGHYCADIVVLLELKAAKALDDIHTAQCLNYLKATGLKIALLINFGVPRVEIKRLVNNY